MEVDCVYYTTAFHETKDSGVVGDKTEIEKSQKLLTGNEICGMNKLRNEVQEAKYKPSCSTNKRSLLNQLLLGPHFVHFMFVFHFNYCNNIYILLNFVVLFSCRILHTAE